MPDLDQLLQERLEQPLHVVPPALADLQRRAVRRRVRRASVVALAACAAVAVALPAVSLPGRAPDTAGYASGMRDGVLDAGEGPGGPWRLVVQDEGTCLRLISGSLRLPSCELHPPGRMEQAAQFPVDAFVVVAGPLPPGTNAVRLTADGTPVVATVSEVGGRLYWSARVPLGTEATEGEALDVDGVVIDRFAWLPVPEEPAAPAPPLPGAPSADGCVVTFDASTGTESEECTASATAPG